MNSGFGGIGVSHLLVYAAVPVLIASVGSQTVRKLDGFSHSTKLVTTVAVAALGILAIALYRNSQWTGKKTYTFASGNKYEGDFLNGKPHGKGIYTFADGEKYEGDFLNGTQHGKGIYTFPSGSKYEGDYLDGTQHGKGVYTFADGSKYEGDFLNGKQHGQGTYTSCGMSVISQFQDNFASGELFHLDNSLFLSQLTQKSEARAPLGYNLGWMTVYLLKNDSYKEHGKLLEKARQTLFACAASSEKMLIELELIYLRLQSLGTPLLLHLSPKRHGLGLRMEQKIKGFIDFEVYNSGSGLKYHKFHPLKLDVFQTAWKKRVPLATLIKDKLQPFLKSFADADQIYKTINDLPGAEDITVDGEPIIWQKEQKANNCSLMWIFVYLRNNMEAAEYTRLRQQIFADCIRAVEQADRPDQKGILANLKAKEAKLKEKYRKNFQQPHHRGEEPIEERA